MFSECEIVCPCVGLSVLRFVFLHFANLFSVKFNVTTDQVMR